MGFFISDAMAAGGGGQPGGQGGFIFLILIVVMFFLMIWPQFKRSREHKKMLAELGKGDEVVTNGGMVGRIVEVGESFTTLEIANNVQVRIQKSAVASVLPKGTMKGKDTPKEKDPKKGNNK